MLHRGRCVSSAGEFDLHALTDPCTIKTRPLLRHCVAQYTRVCVAEHPWFPGADHVILEHTHQWSPTCVPRRHASNSHPWHCPRLPSPHARVRAPLPGAGRARGDLHRAHPLVGPATTGPCRGRAARLSPVRNSRSWAPTGAVRGLQRRSRRCILVPATLFLPQPRSGCLHRDGAWRTPPPDSSTRSCRGYRCGSEC